MRVKTVRRNVAEHKQTEGSFTVPFGCRDDFDLLEIEIVFLGSERKMVYQIETQYLPFNKGCATRFRMVDGGVRWCSKVASHMRLL